MRADNQGDDNTLFEGMVMWGLAGVASYFLSGPIWRMTGYLPEGQELSPLVYIVVFFGFVFLLQGVKTIRERGKEGGLENISMRGFRGCQTELFIFILIISPALYLIAVLGKNGVSYSVGMACSVGLVILTKQVDIKKRIGQATLKLRLAGRRKQFGKGGSARFAGMLSEWSMKFKKGDILLGNSLFGCGLCREKVGYGEDQGLFTIGIPGSGKGRSCIIPNLLEWPHSVLMIDPKGENTEITAARRGFGGGRVTGGMGQQVHVLDPFNDVKSVKTASYNPLSDIDINSIRAREEIIMIADALVVPSGGKNAEYFEEGARILISGIIAHLLSRNGNASLVDMRKVWCQDEEGLEKLFSEMIENPAAGNLPVRAASFISKAGSQERGSHCTQMEQATNWIDSPAMGAILGKSSFDMADLKNGNTTVSLVLPTEMLDVHKRFLRLFVNLAIIKMQQKPIAEKPVLFLLDEFYALGHLKSLEVSAAVLRGYKLKLWAIVQNLGQLKELYPKNWEIFLASSGVIQLLGINDIATAEYAIRSIGKCVSEIKFNNQPMRVVNWLLELDEIGNAIARKGGRMIVLRSEGPPLLLKRMNYDKHYSRNMFNANPFIPGS